MTDIGACNTKSLPFVCTSSLAGPTWLDNVDCSLADRFEDCSHSGWGVHNCAPSESVGLICNPGPSGRIIDGT